MTKCFCHYASGSKTINCCHFILEKIKKAYILFKGEKFKGN